MAKTPRVKRKGVSVHSRAARRAASPSLDLDKSITSIKAPVEDKPKFLGAQNGGISKKKKAKPMTRQQRLRHERGLERADANLSKLEKKVANSKDRNKKVKARAANWEDLNDNIVLEESKPAAPQLDKKLNILEKPEDIQTKPGSLDIPIPDLDQPVPILPTRLPEVSAANRSKHADSIDEELDEID